jgi:hypothetical protein
MVANLLLLIMAGGFGAAWGLAARNRPGPAIDRVYDEMGVRAWRVRVGPASYRYGVSWVRTDISDAVDANEPADRWRAALPEAFESAKVAGAERSLLLPERSGPSEQGEFRVAAVSLDGHRASADSLRVSLSWKGAEGPVAYWSLGAPALEAGAVDPDGGLSWSESGCVALWRGLGTDKSGRPTAWHVVLWRVEN